MKATITVNMENAAFEENEAGTELARILRGLADDLEGHHQLEGVTLRDFNGNRVGALVISS